jgi:hypothetical protein
VAREPSIEQPSLYKIARLACNTNKTPGKFMISTKFSQLANRV